MRRRWLSMIPVLVATVVLLVFWAAKRPEPLPRAPDLLEQIYTAFVMYANESSGAYPPMSAKRAEFVPDMDAFGPYLAGLPEADLLSAYLTGECDVQLCYLGYWVPNQRFALAFLDEYQKHCPAISRGEDVPLEDRGVVLRNGYGLEPGGGGAKVYRLREGLERFMIDVTGPSQSTIERAQACIPVLWEMPDTAPAPGGWVFYMGGQTEWQPYGSFPITEKVVARLRDSMPAPVAAGEDRLYRVDSSPPTKYEGPEMTRSRSPVSQVAADIVDSLPPCRYKLIECDITPTVKIHANRGYRIRIEPGVEVVLFPSDTQVDDEYKERIWPHGPEEKGRVVAYLGVGYGYHWFAHTAVWIQDGLRLDFHLRDGDDRLQHMIDAGAFYLMPRLGDQAMPYLQSTVTDDEKLDHFPDAIMALGQIGTAEARQLISAAFNPGNKDAFRNAEAVTHAADFRSFRYGLGLTDETVDAVVEAFLTLEDQDALAGKAMGYATLTGMFATYHRNRIGRAVLKQLPDDVVDRALDSLREASPSQAQRLERQLRDNQD